ncbi:hypothetical protein MGU_08254 [Metarhizium guizhouense ARSEF 977]|uniref:Integral membrane protein n=1 Tax=Metarhizium guizhouense (strain ARSEF 977) TaxID=1276136 RepID=A0A0B4GCI0_METGA|nr:hypothetical protein MGU_08254 [Metarhizium guizhouense ARSEF 977]
MAATDTLPPNAPIWLGPVCDILLSVCILCWSVAYALIVSRGWHHKSYGMPLLAVAMNVSWECVYAVYVTKGMWLEQFCCAIWLVLDFGIIYTAVRNGPREWKTSSPFVGRHIGPILALLTMIGFAGQLSFATWFLSRPGVGHGDKAGKRWRGMEGYDVIELGFWTGGTVQLVLSASSLAMLLARGHSGAAGYDIW